MAACEILADAAARHGALMAVNDRADIARAAGADVLHLGQDDLPLDIAREIVAPQTLIGRSTHETGEAARAVMDLVRTVALMSPDKPWFAIGGIDEGRLGEVLGAGASRIVVVRAFTEAADPGAAAAWFSAQLRTRRTSPPT